MPRITAILAVAAAALFAAPVAANAARIPVDQAQSDRTARTELQAVATAEDEDTQNGTSTFDVDPCDVTTNGRVAFCDYTMYYASGDACDGEVVVRYTRRGRLVASVEVDYCDSDDAPIEDDATS